LSHLPFPEKILAQHSATLGKTGSGKSSAMRVMVEHQLDRKKRTCVVDPKGDWWGLKTSADGKSAGYPVIAFGNFKEPRATDVPIDQHSGKHVAELIATGNRPCIIGFRGWMPGQMTKFWIDFAPTLFNLNEGELYIFIDEIQNFAAKGKIMDPEAGKCLHWTNRMMAEGRGIGLTFHIASQRAQKVHNDTLDCCETLIAMRTAHPAARASIKDWIDGNGEKAPGLEVLNTMAQLKRGEAWVWSPENGFGPKRVQFPMFRTFDSFAPPQLQKTVSNSGWSEVDLEAVKAKLATVIAEAKANDPRELKAQIADMRKQLAAAQKAGPAPAAKPGDPHELKALARTAKTLRELLEEAMKVAVKINAFGFDGVDVKPEELAAAFEKAATEAGRIVTQKVAMKRRELENLKAEVDRLLTKLNARLGDDAMNITVDVVKNEPVTVRPHVPAAPIAMRPSREVSAEQMAAAADGLKPTHLRVLNNLAELLDITGANSVSKEQLAAWSSYSPQGGGYGNILGSLRTAGMLDYGGAGIVITEAGRRLAVPTDVQPTNAAMLERAKAVLKPAEAKIFEVIHASYPDAAAKEAIAEATGYAASGGGFGNYLGHMRTLGFITYESGGCRCADWMFVEHVKAASA
jgi:hypothetical protein